MKEIKHMTMYLIFVLAFMAQPANAVLIDQGTSTLDQNTGLEWLDISLTDGSSANNALGIYAADGWSLATEAQFYTLFDTYFPLYTDPLGYGYESFYDATTIADATMFNNYFGLTVDSTTTYYSYGQYMGSDGSMKFGGWQTASTSTFTNLHRDRTLGLTVDTGHAALGVFLVRDTTPVEEPAPVVEPTPVSEPATLLLLGLGLAGLGFARRKS
ncbi:MAG: PEP-CTERM sorting domain-containing protein [Gammaproteobacteria bacterium]|nr:PEP-CTERM sorting domain-containing protein [Gammaproteobacteria bacterium]